MAFQAKRMKTLRMAKGYTMEDLAKMINSTKGTISNYENEHSKPNDEMQVSIANALNTTTDYLLGRTDDPSPIGEEPKQQTLDDIIELLNQHGLNLAMHDGFDREGFARLDPIEQDALIKMFNGYIKKFLEIDAERNKE